MGKISDALKKVMEEREKKAFNEVVTTEIKDKKEDLEKYVEIDNSSKDKRDVEPSLLEKIKNIIKFNVEYVAKATDSTGIDPRIVTYFDYSSPIAEQYRILRTNIKTYLYNNKKSDSNLSLATNHSIKEPKIFAITSVMDKEGKSITSANLAVALAKDIESRVLLIDCDLRRGSIHKLFNLPSTPGLSELLIKSYDYSVALHPTAIKNLFVIPFGKNIISPLELLSSKRMVDILDQIRTEPFTYVVIDTPPLIPFTDAVVVGKQTEGVVLVIQAHRTRIPLIERAKSLLESSQVKIIGSVLVQTDYYIPDLYGYSYYYHYYTRRV
ncbi:MAG: CpsD/CapB family tyrosine-protein kinase [Candidatus Omnitrophica bacterium]|nr:CpsD/CapB family tyrosine-protein kinase [Candidatus Omnitrophota bacterium]MCM8826675.1 CpsD/CapB family tyrosine-protein kinase [Candidatus Omnitrophota bacterium]